MGLFDKKYCDVCGEKIGLFGNRKLEDGNLCKSCAAKLSPWFDDRRHSTVEQIKEQLAYREANEAVLKDFRPTKILGKSYMKVYVDESRKQFVVAEKYNDGENHDVIELSQIMNCYMETEENKEEKFREDSEGNQVSFNPPRYEYSYEYYIYIMVNSPFFDEIKIRINDEEIAQNNYIGRREAEAICKEIVEYLLRKPEEKEIEEEEEIIKQNAFSEVWTCKSCGATNTGRFCEYCGTPRSE